MSVSAQKDIFLFLENKPEFFESPWPIYRLQTWNIILCQFCLSFWTFLQRFWDLHWNAWSWCCSEKNVFL